jgi:SAM-dependent methyltransferase
MDRSSYAEANRGAWNTTAPKHAAVAYRDLLERFSRPGYSRLDPFEQTRLDEIGIRGRDIVQLACNNGRELLSLKNLGARHCVGFDISEEFIEQARGLAQAGNIDCNFVRFSVYDIPGEYDGSFDLTYITIGVLGWMPDIDAFFAVAARLLRPAGHIFTYEMHPILDLFGDGPEHMTDPLRISYSYFQTEPFAETGGLDYLGQTSYHGPTSYWFHHKMSDVITALLRNGIAIRAFDEYDHDISTVFKHLESLPEKPPLSYILVGQKY